MHIFILLSAGCGQRFGSDIPKQYLPLDNQPMMIYHALQVAINHCNIDYIQPVIGQYDGDIWQKILSDHKSDKILPPVTGGETRQLSVHSGLKAISAYQPQYVLIHDSARPYISDVLLTNIINKLQECDDDIIGVCPVLPLSDTIHVCNDDASILQQTLSRDHLKAAQTPQAFIYQAISELHHNVKGNNHHDDVAIALKYHKNIFMLNGDINNKKITYHQDMNTDKPITRPKIRIGQGYDTHALQKGGIMILGGYHFDCGLSLQAHSDGDVIIHALCDAIYGALAKGDIGQHFPPSDNQWQHANSKIFAQHALDLCRTHHWFIGNMDITLICQHPKISVFYYHIIESLSQIFLCHRDDIGLKATTNEKMGFIGRGEAIVCMATIMLYQ